MPSRTFELPSGEAGQNLADLVWWATEPDFLRCRDDADVAACDRWLNKERDMGYYRAGDSLQLVSSHIPGLGLPASSSSAAKSSVPMYLSPDAPAYGQAAADFYSGFGGAPGWERPAYRRMNVGNVRALRRSMRRVQAFAKLARRTIQFTQRVKMKKRGRR